MIQQNSIIDKTNKTFTLKKLQKVVSVMTLAILINLFPYLSKVEAAENFLMRFVQELIIEMGKEGVRNYNKSELPVNQSKPFDSEIAKYLAARKVDFFSENNRNNYSGQVVKSSVQRNSDTSESGAVASISWKGGVVTKILFLENQRVRIWSGGKEYLGQWVAKNGTLYVKTDGGSVYRF